MPLWVKKGSLKFPSDKETPVIMVGPGTGVAPFRSVLQERTAEGRTGEISDYISQSLHSLSELTLRHASSSSSCTAANVLFFGCRSKSKDFYFRTEWEEMMEAGFLTLFTAFSRDQVRNTLLLIITNMNNSKWEMIKLPVSRSSVGFDLQALLCLFRRQRCMCSTV